jgi:hypothetical protein
MSTENKRLQVPHLLPPAGEAPAQAADSLNKQVETAGFSCFMILKTIFLEDAKNMKF